MSPTAFRLLALLALLGSGAAPAAAQGPAPAGTVQPKDWGQNGLDLDHPGLRAGLAGLGGTVLTAAGPGRWELREADLANGPFRTWFGQHAHLGAREVWGYVVRCAHPRGSAVTYGALRWEGRFGLARDPAHPVASADDRRWVTACLLAHVNARREHQPISLRGGGLPVSGGEALAMSHPEGVFFGDLFAPDAAAHALSCNLPAAYDLAAATWWPPPVALGRRLAFQGARWLTHNQRAQDHAAWFGGAAPAEQACPGDPASCAQPFRPLVTFGVRLLNLEEPWDAARDGTKRQQLVRLLGFPQPAPSPCATPAAGALPECVGSHDLLKPAAGVCGWESDRVAKPAPPGTVRLGAGARVEAVLRDLEGKARRGDAFTAIVRFRTKEGAVPPAASRTEVQTRALGATTFQARKVRWATLRDDGGFAWLEVYPVYLQEEPGARRGSPLVLDLRLAGKGNAAGAPELDAVGFLPGKPSCCQGPGAPGWCGEVAEGTSDGGVCPIAE